MLSLYILSLSPIDAYDDASSADEVRKGMGLPEVESMQKELMQKIQDKMMAEVEAMSDPNQMMERYLPLGFQGLEQFQKMMSNFSDMNYDKKKEE